MKDIQSPSYNILCRRHRRLYRRFLSKTILIRFILGNPLIYPTHDLVTQSCPTLATPWTVALQAPLSMGFSRARILEWVTNRGIKPGSPALQADSLPTEPPNYLLIGFPGNSVGKESTCSAGHPCSIPGLGRSAGEGIGYPL